jgi:signal transduction histidine kinase
MANVLRTQYGWRADAIDIDLEGVLPDAVCEQAQLGQILTDLVGNALEYSQADCIRVSVRKADALRHATSRLRRTSASGHLSGRPTGGLGGFGS